MKPNKIEVLSREEGEEMQDGAFFRRKLEDSFPGIKPESAGLKTKRDDPRLNAAFVRGFMGEAQ